VPALVVSASFLAYMPYLSSQTPLFSNMHVDLRLPSVLLLSTLLMLLGCIALSMRAYYQRRSIERSQV
jgi:hypothetical protein